MKRIAIGLVIALLAVLAVAYIGRPVGIRHHLIVSAAGAAPLSVGDLANVADIIAVVRPTGVDSVHWNSGDNRPWVPSTNDPRLAMIYNDQQVNVADIIRGPAEVSLVLRNVGGIVGDTWFELEGLEPLEAGALYLVFLEEVGTPTKEGSQRALSFVGQEQGVFSQMTDGGFVNGVGLTVSSDDLVLLR